MLLRFCALNMRNAEQKTAIYLAAENSHHECLDMLASAGALTSLTLTILKATLKVHTGCFPM